jgi:hypothetical protein
VQALTASDGTRLEVSPLQPADKSSLREGVKHLSPESTYRRFFVPTAHLTDGQLTYLTTLDHQRREALGSSDPATGEGVAVARYIQTTDDPATAEIAIAVIDRCNARVLGLPCSIGYQPSPKRTESRGSAG